MPVLLIVFEAGRMKPESKAQPMRQFTKVSVEGTGIPKELFFVIVHEWPDIHIADGGITIANIKTCIAER